MNAPTRRAFLGFAQGAVAAAAVGAIGVRFISSAEAMPVAANLGRAAITTDLATQAQWGPPHGPGWGRSRPRRRRWVCWWHRGRRHCGWRWR
jgi:hypothetical protein